MEVLTRVKQTVIGDFTYTEKIGPKSGESWIHIDNHKTKKNSVLVRKSDLMEFLKGDMK